MTIYPWQRSQWQHLQQQYQQNRLPHALLFTGAAGLGKTDLAFHFAQKLLCEAAENDKPCKQCRSCQLYQAKTHPDFYPITLEEKSKVIKIDQIRYVTQKLTETAQRNRYQVVVLFPAETLHPAAANALLKTLEEPHRNILFILCCLQLGALPATIISRCQRIHFHAAEDAQTLSWLKTQIPHHIDAQFLLRLAGGAPLRAVKLITEDYLATRHSILEKLLLLINKNKPFITVSQELAKFDPLINLQILFSITQDFVKLRLNANKAYIGNSDRIQDLKNAARQLTTHEWLKRLGKIEEAQKCLSLANNLNTQLLIETTLIQWMPS